MSMARNFVSWLISNNLGCLTNVAMDRLLLEKNEPQPGVKGQLIEAERMSAIGRMACSISHDMRHSLTAIHVNAEFLERHDLSAIEKAELLVDIQEAVLATIERLDSLLQFGRSGCNQSFTPGRVSLVVEKAVAAVKRHPDGRNVSITLGKFPPAGPPCGGSNWAVRQIRFDRHLHTRRLPVQRSPTSLP